MAIEYNFGYEIHSTPYHTTVVRTSLTRNLGVLYPDVLDELDIASRELIPQSNGMFPMLSIVNPANALMLLIRLDRGSSLRDHHANRL